MYASVPKEMPILDDALTAIIVIHVVTQLEFYFALFLDMVVYDNNYFETKRSKIWIKHDSEPQHHSVMRIT